jgi:Putative beta-barrel porin 2
MITLPQRLSCRVRSTRRGHPCPGALWMIGKWTVAVGLCWMLLAASGPEAQVLAPAGEGLQFGRIVLYPSFTINASHTNNVFFRSIDLPADQRFGSGVLELQPRVIMEIPFGESHVRWSYAPTYRDYTSDRFTQSDRFSHDFALEGTLRLGPAVTLGVRDHLLRGTVELQEVDQGGELTFGLTPFLIHNPELEVNVAVTGRQGFSILPQYTRIDFNQGAQPFLYDSEQRGLEGRYNLALDPSTTGYLFYSYESARQERDQILFGDVSVTHRRSGLGLRRSLTQDLNTEVRVAYEGDLYEGGGVGSFHGVVVDVSAAWRPTDISRVNLTARRQPTQSFFANNTFYVENQLGLQYMRQLATRFVLQAGVTLRNNVYSEPIDISVTPDTDPSEDQNMDGRIDAFESLAPSVGVRRRDRIIGLQAGIGIRFRPTMALFIGYNLDRRTSNIEQDLNGTLFDPLHYHVGRVGMRLTIGWL